MIGRIKYGKSSLRIVGIYANGDMEKKLEQLKKWMEEWKEGVKTIIEEDFNARTGGEYGSRRKRGKKGKNSKDSKKQRRQNVDNGNKG